MLDVREGCSHGEKNYTNIRCAFWSTYILSELKSNLILQIQHENPDFIIFAGDATDHGYVTEYNDAAAFIDKLKATSEVHSIPGNHDARNVGILHFKSWKNFLKFFHVKNQSLRKMKFFVLQKFFEFLRDF